MRYALLALGKQKRTENHHGAIPYADSAAALAFAFMAFTAARTGEGRGATWGEIDTGAATWTIPAERMKSGREHRIPLSPAAEDVLREAYGVNGGFPSGFIFPNNRDGGMISNDISNDGLRQLIVRRYPDTTAQGWRSTFRDWGSRADRLPCRDSRTRARALGRDRDHQGVSPHGLLREAPGAHERLGGLFEQRTIGAGIEPLNKNGGGLPTMSEYTFADRLLAYLAVSTGGVAVVVHLLALFGVIEPGTAAYALPIIFPILLALMIFSATRYSAVEERKQRREYEERIEALLKRIADNSSRP